MKNELKTYIIKCECVKIIDAESVEEAENQVINDLTLGYGCESADVITSDALE